VLFEQVTNAIDLDKYVGAHFPNVRKLCAAVGNASQVPEIPNPTPYSTLNITPYILCPKSYN
jgi:hypothetical protein